MAAVRVVAGLGYGLATFLFIKNSEGLGDYMSEIARTTVHFWSRSPHDKTIRGGGGEGSGRELGELSDKLDKIASMKRETVHVHHGRDGWSAWITTAVGGTVAIAVVVHMTGLFDLSGVMYVTQSKFKTATEALKEGIDAVSKALNKTRLELLERIGVLENRLENVSTELKTQIVSSAESVKEDIAKVSSDVRDVGSLVNGLEDKLGSIEGGVGDLRTALDKANRGIQLLCHVVADSYRYSTGNQKDQKWYSDLLTYTKAVDAKNSGDVKQLKQNGEGPIMKLVSSSKLNSNPDSGAGLSSIRDSLTRQLSGVLDSS